MQESFFRLYISLKDSKIEGEHTFYSTMKCPNIETVVTALLMAMEQHPVLLMGVKFAADLWDNPSAREAIKESDV